MKWFRQSSIDSLPVAMAGLKLGNRLLVIGCSDPKMIASLAAKVGLTGRACATDDDEGRAKHAAHVAEAEGVLIEAASSDGKRLPYQDEEFDIVVVRTLTATAAPEQITFREAARVLRPGGRCLWIAGETPRGVAAIARRATQVPIPGDALSTIQAAGFLAVRILAEREGMAFVEGVKPRGSD